MRKSYQVVFSKRAERDLKKKDPDVKRQIIVAAEALGDRRRPPSSKRMKGEYKGYWRERTGNYRKLGHKKSPLHFPLLIAHLIITKKNLREDSQG